MLYLSRKVGESIIINNNIELTVVEVKGKSAKLGFNFPSDVTVLRKELHDKVTEENRMAAGQPGEDFSAFLSFTDDESAEDESASEPK